MLDKIYILHHKPLTERKKLMINRLNDEGINIPIQWVENWLPEEVSEVYNEMLKDYDKFIDIEIEHSHGTYHNFSKKMSIGELSLYLKHEWCLENQILNNYTNVLLLEDDCKIPYNFKKYIDNNMKDFSELNSEKNVELLIMGTSHSRTTKGYKGGKYAHFDLKQVTRCAHAIVYNINGTNKILPKLCPRTIAYDFKLNEIIISENINVAWSEPGLVQNSNFYQNSIKSER